MAAHVSGGAYKRKRKAGPSQAMVLYKQPYKSYHKKRRTTFVPGVDRTGGYYGRYSGRDAELKFHDVDLDDAVIVNTGAITATINIIAQGVTESERVGRKCTIRSINWRYRYTLPSQDAGATPPGGENMRTILYVDKQCNGAAAAVTDVLESADWKSFRNLSNSGRFNILFDRTDTMNYLNLASDGAGVVSSSNSFMHGSFYKKCHIPIEFSSTTGVIGEIRSNNLGVLQITQVGTAGFFSKIRLRFSDQG